MYGGQKIAAFIPARKGSKGIPDKNITDLNGIPLIAHSIIQARESALIDKIIVSTDSEEIAKVAEEYGAAVKGLRPDVLSGDTAVLYDVMNYEIRNHELKENSFDIIVLLQPTSPLRQTVFIDSALRAFVDEQQLSAVSVSEVREHPIFMRTISEEGKLQPVLTMKSTVRRQDLPAYYRVNGMIYINKIEDILKGFVSFNDNISPIVIPEGYDVDIDTMDDLEKARRRLTAF